MRFLDAEPEGFVKSLNDTLMHTAGVKPPCGMAIKPLDGLFVTPIWGTRIIWATNQRWVPLNYENRFVLTRFPSSPAQSDGGVSARRPFLPKLGCSGLTAPRKVHGIDHVEEWMLG